MTDNIIKLWIPVTKTPSGSFMGILSDTSIDRDGEFMTRELLQDWAKNVSVKALVNHENKMEKWVGGWKNLILVENGDNSALIGEPWFFSGEANPLAQQVRRQVEESLMNGENAGISIGAIPREHIDKEINGKSHKGYTKAELLEGTWVPIQSNRNAYSFARMAKQFNIDIELTKPKEVEDCVSSLMADSEFKPQEGRTKEESAYAVCQSRHGKCSKVEVNKMTEEVKIETPLTLSEELKKEVNNEKVKEENVEKMVDNQKIVDSLKSENVGLKKQLEDLKTKAVLKPTMEKVVLNGNGNDEPLTIERMLKMRYRGGK